jgi:hypothetical protein
MARWIIRLSGLALVAGFALASPKPADAWFA